MSINITLKTRMSIHYALFVGLGHNRYGTNKVTCRHKSVIMNGFLA